MLAEPDGVAVVFARTDQVRPGCTSLLRQFQVEVNFRPSNGRN